jgi:ATP-dependent Lon protease
MKNSGLEAISACQINFSEEALEYLIENYCREAGVRSLSQ